MPDKSHAANAKARATQQKKKGTITASEKAKIDRKADRMLDKEPFPAGRRSQAGSLRARYARPGGVR